MYKANPWTKIMYCLCTFQQKGTIKLKNITKLDASVISVLFSAFSNNTYKKKYTQSFFVP